MFSNCADCGQGFFYARNGAHSRRVTRCPQCKTIHDREANRARVAKCRAKKREAKKQPNKQTRSKAIRLARGGETLPTIPKVKAPKGNGLYASEKEPAKSKKRAKVGLPTDA